LTQIEADWQLFAAAQTDKKGLATACVAGSFLASSEDRTGLLTICAIKAPAAAARDERNDGVAESNSEKRSKKIRRVTPYGCARRSLSSSTRHQIWARLSKSEYHGRDRKPRQPGGAENER
jgi:hypothetical protein